MEVQCTICNKKIERKPYQIKQTKNPFCSFGCYGKWQKVHRKGQFSKPKISVKCATCGKPKEIYPHIYKINKHHFCNNSCVGKWKSLYQSGENSPAWLGGHTQYRGSNWKQQSQFAKQRDNNKCQNCGTKENLIIHHIKPYHLFSTHIEANKLDNLITLCTKCHGKKEFELIKNGIHKNRQFPNTTLPKICNICRKLFYGSPRAIRCINCCTYKCKKCNKTFISRKRKYISFCSKKCFQEYHTKHSKFTRQCSICGKTVKWGSLRCWKCFSKNMKILVKAGRPKKH